MKTKHLLLEMDGLGYLVEGDQWMRTDFADWDANRAGARGAVAVLTDFSVNPDYRLVYGDRQYAKFLLERELRESGAAVANTEVLIHSTNRIDKLNTQLLYSLVASAELERLRDRVDQWGADALLYSIYGIYEEAIKRNKQREATVFVFVLPGSVDIAAVSNGRIESFESLPGFSADQFDADNRDVIVNALSDSIVTQERIAKLKLSNLCVFEVWSRKDSFWIEELAKNTGLQMVNPKMVPIEVDGVGMYSSMAPLFDHLSPGASLSSKGKQAENTARLFLPIVALLMAVLCAGVYFYNDGLAEEIRGHQTRIAGLQNDLAREQQYDAVEAVNYQQQLEGVESVLQAGFHPSFNQMLNTIHEASKIENRVIYDVLNLNYPESMDSGKVTVSLVGFIGKGWEAPLKAFDRLSNNFSSKGFGIVGSEIDVVDSGLNFALELELASSLESEPAAGP